MQLVKLITPKRINTLRVKLAAFLILFFSAFQPAFSQDNSPYSRYGIGDLVPPTNINSRGLGGLSAAFNEPLSINFSNPASFSSFQTDKELKSNKLKSGRAILDVGINLENRTLKDPAFAERFTASNALFSYVQVGVPLKQNWGLSFGLRPISRISYKIRRRELLYDPITSQRIDSAETLFSGSGGSYLASMGTGFSLFKRLKKDKSGKEIIGEEKLSVGFTAGYLFGEKDYSTKRTIFNDTLSSDYYNQANYQTTTNYGNLNFSAGIQYKVPLKKNLMLTLGAYGAWGQTVNASQDVLRETFIYDASIGEVRLDSVSDKRNVKGKIDLPSSITAGFVLQKYTVINKEGGWLIGVDFAQQSWDKYRFYGQIDSVQSKWEIRVGGQLNPIPKRNYFSNIAYRFGFFMGPDYIKVGKKLNQIGGSFGLGLPLATTRQAPNQATLINLAFEYGKRGNNSNLLSESLFRVSLGFSLSDFWFIKRKYD